MSSKFNKFINLKMGLFGAFLMGGIVFWINLDHGWFPATTAGLKQWLYTFFIGGIIIKLLENVLKIIKNPFLSVLFAVSFISSLTIFLVYLVHSIKGTPEPFLSTVPTIILAPPGFLVLSLKFNHSKEETTPFSNEVVQGGKVSP